MGKASRRKREKPRTVEVGPEGAAIIREQIRLFREKFGRDMGPDDPIFFDPDADEPRRMDADTGTDATIEAMADAGIRAELIYAYRKTGLLVSDENYEKLSTEDRADWHAAIEEYRQLTRRKH
ncbi:MAG TPA: hypothetical protein VNY05_41060 [Candidatus Acidoferrales bacterium]|nr:hypothetical protein [Candidatus Acidoferrales bacterium]